MLETERRKWLFKIKEIWFGEYPFDVRDYDAVYFYACKNRITMPGFSSIEAPTLVVDLTQDMDLIWRNMDKSSCRYAIGRARRDGIKVMMNQNYEEFYSLNRSLRKSKGLSPAWAWILKDMRKYGTLFVCELDGEILGGQFYLEDETNIRWLIGASKRLQVDKVRARTIGNANKLLVWEAMIYAKAKGIREFDLGGIYVGEAKDEEQDGIRFFKKGFGGKLTTKHNYEKHYSGLYTLAKTCRRALLNY